MASSMTGHSNKAFEGEEDGVRNNNEKKHSVPQKQPSQVTQFSSQDSQRSHFGKKEPYQRRPWRKRYGNAVKQMLPVRGVSREPKNIMPGPSRGCLSLFSLHWLTGLMWKAFSGSLGRDDIWQLRDEDASFINCDRLERHWEAELRTRGPRQASLSRVVLRAFRVRIAVASFFMCVAVILQFIGPSILLKMMLDYVNDVGAPYTRGVFILVLIVACQVGRTYCFRGISFITSLFSSFRAAGGLQLMIYRKLLRLRLTSDQMIGKVVNICMNDMERLAGAFTTAPLVLSALVMFIFAMAFNLVMIGPWSLVGFGMIFLSYPILGGLAALTSVLRVEIVADTDRRVNQVAEILAAMRLIKMYAWEESFRAKIHELRSSEHKPLQKLAFLVSLSSTISPYVAVLATLATILGYVLSGNILTAEAAFTTFAVFNAMQFSIGTLPYGIKMVTEVHVALRRTKRLLLMPEVALEEKQEPSEHAVDIQSATFGWEKPVAVQSKAEKKRDQRRRTLRDANKSAADSPPKPEEANGVTSEPTNQTNGMSSVPTNQTNGGGTSNLDEKSDSSSNNGDDTEARLDAENATVIVTTLRNVSLQIGRGKLVGVAGSVGSGKSSLIAAIMGQLRLEAGSRRVAGPLAVVSQTAWIFGGSLRDNILFGAPLQPELYNRVLDVCALRPDLELMEQGDLSQIGERGLNLSGGQKQRVSMARALYSDAETYLLDDPLSAVDSKVGNHIFTHCIRGHLAGKTVLLVSHGVQYLSQCDEVLMMMDGRVVERGTHQELMERQGDYFSLVSFDKAHSTAEQSTGQPAGSSPPDQEVEKNSGQKVADEKFEGKYGFFHLIYLYIKPAGLVLMLFVILLISLFGVSRTANGIYLRYWLDCGDDRQEERLRNMTEYNATYTPEELVGVINDSPYLNTHIMEFCMITGIMIVLGFLKGASVALRVINGATTVHNRMFDGLMRCKMSFFDANPAGRIINRFSRDMDELDNKIPMLFEFLLQSSVLILVQFLVPAVSFPAYAVLVAIVLVLYGLLASGLIRGVRDTKKLENMVRSPVLHHIASTVAGLPTIRAFSREEIFAKRFEQVVNTHTSANLQFRLASMWFSLRLDELGCIMVTAVALFVVLAPTTASPAMVGLMLSLVYGSVTFVSFVIRMIAEMSARLTSVERCDEYIKSLDFEAPAHVPERAPPADWPQKGSIELRGVSLRYRPQLPRVLHQISLSVRPGEKLGVVGRTGAGKSTLISTLLRIAEIEEGQILIDGVDIGPIGLYDLRSHIDVIPQDPVLFSGTIRMNLDPFDEHTDEKLWGILEKAKLKRKVQRAGQQLQTCVASDGDNFSVGERQLICLARALLRENRILLLDEATASVDVETDHLIQRTIQEHFATCTVITIAHRLNTVAGYDRIVVMDAGRVAECDTPLALMERQDSQFRQMMAHAGFTTTEQLQQLRSHR